MKEGGKEREGEREEEEVREGGEFFFFKGGRCLLFGRERKVDF